MRTSNTTKKIIEMVEKHGGLYYMGKCTDKGEYKGQYTILHKSIGGEYKVYLATKTQKEMIEKLSQVVD